MSGNSDKAAGVSNEAIGKAKARYRQCDRL
jgi:hypothetical protein